MDEHIEDLFPFYAMGSVTEEEQAAVEAYVKANPEAQARLEAAMAIGDDLAFMADPISPSPSVKRETLAYARRRPHVTAVPAPTVPHSRRQGFWSRMTWPIFAGLATVTAVLLFIWALSLQASNTELEKQVATLQQTLVEREAILTLLAAGEGIAIAGTEHQPEAAGQLVVAPNGVTAVLAVANLTHLSPEQTYQLWLIGDDGPVSVGLFTVDPVGLGTLAVEADSAVYDYQAIGVSIEPAGGSPQPTGDIVMLSEIPPRDSGS